MPEGDLKVHEDRKVDTSHGDHERFAHYVDKNDMMNATVFGTPIKALCGKVWVPSRDPKKYSGIARSARRFTSRCRRATTATALRSSGRTRVSRVRSEHFF